MVHTMISIGSIMLLGLGTAIVAFLGGIAGGSLYGVYAAAVFIFAALCFVSKKCAAADAPNEGMLRLLSELHSLELAETVRVLQAQRHEFVNHLQVIYGMLQTDKVQQLPEYIQRANREISMEEQLHMLPAGEFRHVILTGRLAARSGSIDLDLNVVSAERWLGFQHELRMRNLCFRLLLHNTIDILTFWIETDKRIAIQIIPEQNQDTIQMHIYPAQAVQEAEIFRLPPVFFGLMGRETKVDIKGIWEQFLGGQIHSECQDDGSVLLTLISPRNE